METNQRNTCCFFGHRKIELTEDLVCQLKELIKHLITDKGVDTFLFGSRSDFDTVCLALVTELKKKYPHIRRIYVRAEFPYISESYEAYLLERYEESYYPERIGRTGRAVYIRRNYEMIDHSGYCVIYYDENYMPPRRKQSKSGVADYQPNSGTKLAFEYAKKKGLTVVNVWAEREG